MSPHAREKPVLVVAHPPERWRVRSGTPAQAGQCCCCCCCCCLHSVGSLVGAAVTPLLWRGRGPGYSRTQEEEDYGDPSGWAGDLPDDPGRRSAGSVLSSAVAVFWLSSLALVLAALALAGVKAIDDGNQAGLDIVVGLVLLALGFPALQLIAAVVTAIVLGVSSRTDKGYQFKQLGKIALGVLAGTILGLAIMAGVVVVARLV